MSVTKSLFALSAVAVVMAASVASAATIVTGNTPAGGVTTPGPAGNKTYTLTATTNVAGGKIIGFNFDSGGGSGLGISGAMIHQAPFGAVTVFNDTAAAQYTAAGTDILADSHFLVRAADGIAVNATETPTTLAGAWNANSTGALTNALAFAQIVVPGAGTVAYKGQFTIETPTGNILEDVQGVVPIPEPATAALVGLSLIGLAATRRRVA